MESQPITVRELKMIHIKSLLEKEDIGLHVFKLEMDSSLYCSNQR